MLLGIFGELARARCMLWPLSVQETPGSIYSIGVCHHQLTQLFLHCQQQLWSGCRGFPKQMIADSLSATFTSTFSCVCHDCRAPLAVMVICRLSQTLLPTVGHKWSNVR